MAKEKNQSSTEFARDLVMLVLSAGRILTWQAARGVPAGSLTPTQAQLLEYVFQHPGASLTEVADHLAVRPPTASAMVMRLSAMKLIASKQHATERRKISLSLTPAGVRIMTNVGANIFGSIAEALDRLPATDRDRLRDGARIFSDVIKVLEAQREGS